MGSARRSRSAQAAPGLCPRPPGSRGRAGAAALRGRRGGGAAAALGVVIAALGVVIAVAAVAPVPAAPPPAALPRPHSRYGRGEGQTRRIPVPPRHPPPEEGVPGRGRPCCRYAPLRARGVGPARPFPRRGAAAPRRVGAAGSPRPSRGGGRVSSRPWPLSVPPEPRPGRPPEGSPRRRSRSARTKAAGGRARWGSTARGSGALLLRRGWNKPRRALTVAGPGPVLCPRPPGGVVGFRAHRCAVVTLSFAQLGKCLRAVPRCARAAPAGSSGSVLLQKVRTGLQEVGKKPQTNPTAKNSNETRMLSIVVTKIEYQKFILV